MKKSNVILRNAVAGALFAMAGGAQAGTLTGGTVFATEIAGPTATSALAIQPGAIAYTFNTPGGIVINPGGAIYVYQRLSSGLFAAAPASTSYALSAGITGIAATAVALSTDSTTVRITLTNTTAGTSADNQTIGVGGTLTWTPAAGAINNVHTTLATVGGAVNMQASVSSTSSSPNTGTALPADLDNGLSNTLAVATAAEAITGAVAASSIFTPIETQRIDLTAATGPGSRFTAPGAGLSNANSPVLVNLGSVTFTNAAGTQAINDGTTDYTIAGRGTANTLAGTVTGSFKTGATMILATDAACTTGIVAGSTGTLNAGLTTFTFTGGTLPTTAVPVYICLGAPATAGSMPETTPTASFTFTKTTTTDKADSAAGTLYALAFNGSQVDVRNYVPAAATGYATFLRVMNTGSVSAAVSAAVIDDTTGTAGAAGVLGTLAAGASRNFTQAEVEAAAGTVAATSRPRIRITAPTNGLQVQSFLAQPNGTIVDMTGAQ